MILNFIRENKKKLLILLIVIIVLFIISFIINNNSNNKIYVSESYVYTKESYEHSNELISKLPYINIKGNSISEINTELINKYYEVIAIDDMFMDYVFYKNNDIISVVVEIRYLSSPNAYPSDVIVYNIDIESGKVLTDEEVIDFFDISFEDVSDAIYDEIREYYDYENKKGYFITECDFDCYLSKIKAFPILDNCKYYIKDKNLIVYKNLQLGNEFYYDVNSGFDLFRFKIKNR